MVAGEFECFTRDMDEGREESAEAAGEENLRRQKVGSDIKRTQRRGGVSLHIPDYKDGARPGHQLASRPFCVHTLSLAFPRATTKFFFSYLFHVQGKES